MCSDECTNLQAENVRLKQLVGQVFQAMYFWQEQAFFYQSERDYWQERAQDREEL